MGVIYKITNKINGKIYIGQTRVTEPQRWQQHIWHAYNDPSNDSLLLCRAIKKYGKENFTRTIVEECDNWFLNEREKYWIKYFDSTNHNIGYNITEGGEGHSKYSNEELLKAYIEYSSVSKASEVIGMGR
jgi:group I intron endonuclease